MAHSSRAVLLVASTLALAGCGDYEVEDYVKDHETADVDVKSCRMIGKAPYDVNVPGSLGEVWKCSVNETASSYGFNDRCYVVVHGYSAGVARGLACSLVADAP